MKVSIQIITVAVYFLFTTLTGTTFAQDGRRVQFDYLTTKGGLSHNLVYSVLQDSQKFMWFGTRYGLNKYDGSGFTVYTYTQDDPNSLSDNFVWTMFEDRAGTLWIGTWGGGLNKFDPVTETFVRYQHDANNPNSVSNNYIWSIYQDHTGQLWIATEQGLNQFDPTTETFVRYQHDPNNPNSLSHNSVSLLYEDKARNLWIGTYGGGLNKLDPSRQTFTHYQHDKNNPKSLSNDFIWTIHGGRSGDLLWIGSEGGLNQFDFRTESFRRYQHEESNPQSLSHNTILSLYEDQVGILWVGTYGGGLNLFDRKNLQFVRYKNDARFLNNLSDNLVWFINADVTHTLWVATEIGLNKYDPGSHQFAHYQHNPKNINSLSNNLVSSFYEDEQQILWIGTRNGGLNRFDRNNNRFKHYSDSLNNNGILAIKPDSHGHLWFGTEGGGLIKFDPKTEQFIRYQSDPKNPNSLASDVIMDIGVDAGGIVWVGMDGGGLDKFDPEKGTYVHYRHDDDNPNSLVTDWVKNVFVDSSGAVWAGADGGLSRLEPMTQTFTNYHHDDNDPHSLSSNTINTVFEDHQGIIWVGTNSGLNKLNHANQTFTIYHEEQGLASNNVTGILEDNQGYLWLSTTQGLSKFDPKTETFRNYDKHDSLQDNTFLRESAYKNHQTGELFFGGINGFNAFYPDRLVDNPYKPPVKLTDFLLFNQSVSIGQQSPLQKHINLAEQITLSDDQSVFSFEFAALNYRASAKNQYAYMMEGFDKDWTYVDSQRRFATYTNLDAGEYTFRVKASNNDGLWNEAGTSVKVLILPPWWQTWWAYSLYTIIILGSLIGFVIAQQRKLVQTRAINERLQQADKLKDEFLANTSHELRTPLNGIIGIAESLLEGAAGELTAQTKTNLGMIVSSGKRLSALVNDILDFSKLKHKDIGLQLKPISSRELADVVLNLSQLLVAQKPVELKNQIEPNLPFVMADENRLQQILHNLVGNAIKFTEQGEVKIEAQTVNQQLQISVSDTGIGIEQDKLERIFESFEQAEGGTDREYGGTGLGLAVTKKLVELHGGQIWVESTPKKGSKFIFTLPISDETESEPLSVNTPLLSKMQTTSESTVMHLPPTLGTAETSASQDEVQEDFNILIVDDEPINLQVLSNYLSLLNYDITQASSGTEALALVEAGLQPAAILLDVMMPRMTGYEVTKKLREKWPADQLPIVLLTAKNQIEDLVAGLESGANDYLTKPISKDELIARLNTHIHISQLKAESVRFVEQLEMSRRQAEVANEAKTAFLANVSHELRTPLNAILGYTQIFNYEDNLSDMVKEGSKLIEQNSQHLLTLLNDIIDISTLEHGEVSISPIDMRFDSFLNNLIGIFQHRAKEKGLVFHYTFSPELPLGIVCDEKRLRQILTNLLGNAIKFTQTGSITFSVTRHENKIRFLIKDTGAGIAQEYLDKIFLPFEQVSDWQHKSAGAGLGLSLVKKLLDALDGTVQVSTEVNQGSCFEIDLPLVESHEHILGETVFIEPKHSVTVAETIEEQSELQNAIQLLNVEQFTALQDASMTGDIGTLAQYAKELEEASPEFTPLVKTIRQVVETFDTETIINLLTSANVEDSL
ncbi:ATP-binding protein [Candidatus Albibeggiatoa sp. nov. NOAA]|uniref:ATP-binding protein n=1 Tax=Candidatus Albibeggiatoa sp. nov. NOAA TaxID=3162724 RepID=UPI0032F3DB7D|nr:ATP-binding protein [Thiotrichaceae bacterium]